MSVAVLTFTASETEITSGVPEYVEIESNIPANIYYTTDGSTPTTESNIYVDYVYFPADGTPSFTLSAFGVDADGYSGSVLTQVFAADQTNITVARLVDGEGIIVDEYDDQTNREDGFGADGAAVRFVDIDEEHLDIIRSAKGRLGIEEGTQVEVNIPSPEDTANPYDNQFEESTTTQFAATFNPYAKTIVIDNRIENEVSTTLRTYGSMSNIYTEYGGKRIRESADDACYVSGGFVKRFYNKVNNTMVSFYFDHNSGQWVKNIQTLPSNVSSTIGRRIIGHPFVFAWIPRGKQSSNMV